MINVIDLCKSFSIKEKRTKTQKIALNKINFSIKDGEVIGLVGKNGSGKSTLLKIMCGLYKPTSGSVSINNLDVSHNVNQIKQDMGVLFGGDAGLYKRLSARENIEYFAQLNGLKIDEIQQNLNKYVEFFNMENYIDRKIDNFSRGMKQKTCFIRSIIHNPSLIILDEPSTGLDVQAIEEVANFIKLNKKENKTIILSSHNMDEILKLCDKVIVLNSGNLTFFGPLSDVVKNNDLSQLYNYMEVSNECI